MLDFELNNYFIANVLPEIFLKKSKHLNTHFSSDNQTFTDFLNDAWKSMCELLNVEVITYDFLFSLMSFEIDNQTEYLIMVNMPPVYSQIEDIVTHFIVTEVKDNLRLFFIENKEETKNSNSFVTELFECYLEHDVPVLADYGYLKTRLDDGTISPVSNDRKADFFAQCVCNILCG